MEEPDIRIIFSVYGVLLHKNTGLSLDGHQIFPHYRPTLFYYIYRIASSV